jgi:hypothetical protein
MLGGVYVRTEGNRITKGYHTCSYIVKRYYLVRLLDNFECGLKKLLFKKFRVFPEVTKYQIKHDNSNHIDVYWCKLQEIDNWRCILPAMVSQIESYSDNIGA